LKPRIITRQLPDDIVQALTRVRIHAGLGLDPTSPVGLAGVHVSYRQAADRQPRPEIVVQLSQRRADLEDQGLDPDSRPICRAGTTIIARADGVVTYVIAKPLPLADESVLEGLAESHPARDFHTQGTRRLKAFREWPDTVEEADPVSAWTNEPALWRLDFAALHAEANPEVPNA
jgi:hypothetical protein